MQNILARWAYRYPIKTRRFLEILPGFVSWSLILFPIWGSLLVPTIVAYYIIAFAVYWFYRSASVAVLAVIGHFRLRAAERFDWLGDVKTFPGWKKVKHVILVPTYKEPVTTLVRLLSAIEEQTFPLQNIHVVMSFEEREGEAAEEKRKTLTRQFGKSFGSFLTTMHPDIAGEVKGKSANTSWAARFAKLKLVDERGLDPKFMTVTNADADSILHPSYLAALTYQFLDHPNRYRRIWQPAVVFYNNIWKVPAPIRVLASVWSVVHLYVLMRQGVLINFSTYSTSMQMIIDIGFWDTDVIPEDFRLFFKSFFHFKGDLEVEPIFLPVKQDAPQSTSYFRTLINQYEQVKRWAWGVVDNPYIVVRFLTVPEVPFWKKTVYLWQFVQTHFLWPVNWFAITVGAFFPPLLNPVFARTTLGKTLPQVSSAILTISLVSLVAVWIVHVRQRPKAAGEMSVLRQLLTPVELLLLPVLGFFFSALPGLDAHTRLMLGRYIEYRVTEKV
ncbi:MAG: glycosyltransferase family 2 protein [Candidatus Chisholmbacteria bacterium]|nr:glycosyltransferase family 2 protein [Candidatus Chisholmbacteria bacterium]